MEHLEFSMTERGRGPRRPEQSLYSAILCQAIRDLTSKDAHLRKDAIIFLLGPIASKYLSYLDTEDTILVQAVTIHCKPDEIDKFSGAVPAASARTRVAPAPHPCAESHYGHIKQLLVRPSAPGSGRLLKNQEGMTR